MGWLLPRRSEAPLGRVEEEGRWRKGRPLLRFRRDVDTDRFRVVCLSPSPPSPSPPSPSSSFFLLSCFCRLSTTTRFRFFSPSDGGERENFAWRCVSAVASIDGVRKSHITLCLSLSLSLFLPPLTRDVLINRGFLGKVLVAYLSLIFK